MGTNAKRALILAFFAAMVGMAVATALSPYFPQFVVRVIQDRTITAGNLEQLRRSTPLWMGAIDRYNTALYRMDSTPNRNIGRLGKDGFVFLGDGIDQDFSQAIRSKVLSDAEVADQIEIIRLQRDFAARRGIAYLVAPAPAKWEIYPEKLPEWAQDRTKLPSTLDKLVKAAQAGGLPLLDARESLRKARSTAETYVAMDSHWTEFGAWVGWKQIAAELERQVPGLSLKRYLDIKGVKTEMGPSEMRNTLNINRLDAWTKPEFVANMPPYVVPMGDGVRVMLNGDVATGLDSLPRTTENPASDSALNVFWMRDSMGNQISTLFQASFRRVVQTTHFGNSGNAVVNVPGIVARQKPDAIVLSFTERYAIRPFGDLAYWRAVDAFDKATGGPRVVWAQGGTGSPLRLEGDMTLTKSLGIVLPQAPFGARQVLRFAFESKGPGGVVLAYSDKGKTVSRFMPTGDGYNEHFVELPAEVDANVVWAYRDVTRGGLVPVSVELRYPDFSVASAGRAAFHEARVAALMAMRDALKAYHAAYGRYPVSEGWDGFRSRFGKSSEAWIAGLAPQFLPDLPRDPARSEDPDLQYLYRSDGQDYKLIAHDRGECLIAVTAYPDLTDPVRNCWAYGVWSSDRSRDW